jgi:bifunctional UDP-N-acetylglucosamine pyrophosphorylase/glucosamine-1-phosphate N-acetyltransferase
MKAVILAAGKGERLKPLTETRPKHLIPLGGRPLLEWTLFGLREAGVSDVLLVTHFMEEQIMRYFGDGSQLGMSIKYIHQEKMRGTAEAFSVAEEYVEGENFIGVYGDLFVSPNSFRVLLENHDADETTISVLPVDDPSQWGIVELEGNHVRRIVEKPPIGDAPSNLANAGLYVFNPKIFQSIRETGLSKRNEYEITDSIQILLDSCSKVTAVILSADGWLDIGLPWNILEANKRALELMVASVDGEVEDGAFIHGHVTIAEGARVRSGAYIEGPAYIGPDSDIGPNCYIRPATSIGANVRIGNACEIKNSVVMNGTHIAHLSYVGDSIIGEECNFGAGTITANIRFDKEDIRMSVKGRRENSGRRKLGAIVGDRVQTGINVNLLPGVKIGSGAWVAPGFTVSRDVPSGFFLR